jgi:2-polyprenyl-6-methoxyphenol hydroxylase-like FAD-dependent oxidoreductase
VSSLGRVVLVGDAAHAIPPTVGQSGAISLEDAATLATTLVIQRTKTGANIRKVDVDDKQQAEKGKNFTNAETMNDLSWLYGYNAWRSVIF